MSGLLRWRALPASLRRIYYEVRLSLGWVTLLPPLSFSGGLLITTYLGRGYPAVRVEGIVSWYRYVGPVTSALALTPIILREGQWHTIDLVRSRTTLWRFSALRSTVALALPVVVSVAVTLILRHVYAPVSVLQLTTLYAVNLGLLTTLGLLGAHLLGESVGYGLIAVVWLILAGAPLIRPDMAWWHLVALAPNDANLHSSQFVWNRVTLLGASVALFVAQIAAAACIGVDPAE